MSDERLTHLDENGQAHMVDVSAKPETERTAVARGEVHLHIETLELIRQGLMKKGDVLGVARIAGIQAAKKTSELIPLCHPLPIHHVQIQMDLDEHLPGIKIEARVKTSGKTGVEMEALTAVQVALLTVYDMCKAVDRDMVINGVRVTEKRGGKSGYYTALP